MIATKELDAVASAVAAVLSNPKNSCLTQYKWPAHATPCKRDLTQNKKYRNNAPQAIASIIEHLPPLSSSYSQADQLIDFRRQFSLAWNKIPSEDIDTKIAMYRWVTKTWGGISNNSNETLNTIVSEVDNGNPSHTSKKGISSKSKCFAFTIPCNYFVYDSRISIALNKIVQTKLKTNWQFPIVTGRSAAYKEFIKTYNKSANKEADYNDYCILIKKIAKLMKNPYTGHDVQRIEFMLFMIGGCVNEIQI